MNALDELRERLLAAARHDVKRTRARRRRRRAAGAIVLVALGGGAVAAAADLISVGEPVANLPEQNPRYLPADASHGQIAVTARSGRGLPVAVAIYTARNGDSCALAGDLRGTVVGRIEGKTFRPYERDRAGACGRPGRLLVDRTTIGDRTLVFGRAPPAARRARIRGTARTAPIGRGGAFVFLFKRLPPRDFPVVEVEE